MIRLLVADDHGIMRAGLKNLFDIINDIEVVGEAENSDQVINAVKLGGFDVILLDLTMPGMNGIDVIKAIREHAPSLPILVLSMHDEPPIVRRALKAGANGYITKETNDPSRLLMAIRTVATGGNYIDPKMAERLAFDTSSHTQPPHEKLSDREFEIFKLLAQGMSVMQIADILFISNKTVSSHKARLMRKMDLGTNTDLVRYALDHHMLD
ncbi:response regulator transcription factor [Pseudomonas sp.]|uniref:response regulator transcription factor n=1 Tax=Pseudomonas sp. TaxID=306 RepID=UPI002CAAB3EF|nr:response regulator transcription factor [Pseudomonas sp.]HUE94942.1 response regulator transcription factor [Pseudomonas sp.]